MKLWIDDIRNPPDRTWNVCRTVPEAKEYLNTGVDKIEEMSIDHDMGTTGIIVGPCFDCKENPASMDDCPFCNSMMPTGYDLICWMEENDIWPKNPPRVHSQNVVGKKNMELAINRHYEK